ncbi:MAG TPA: hypothetical protein RMH99_07710 [Sandaracinaceae bacterium LLY-WYZ-13_1]|nr:hypothetical protein [Sandaracinaceae bacterium LLY-WYZ-13_1]
MTLRASFLSAGLVALLAACSSSHGRGTDAGGGEPCGPTTCDPGTVCCNASCGICTGPGEGCPAIACRDAGAPTDGGGSACGDGTCAVGERCCPGCAPDEGWCAPAGSPCPRPACPLDAGVGRSCGGFGGATCDEDEVCDYPDGSSCGGDDSTGVCIPRPDGCPEPVCRPVCGCDGDTYCSPCDAHANGTDVANEGACGDPGACAPMDARGEGPCAAFFGYAWDGERCAGLSGCACEGADCDATYETPEACLDDHVDCVDDCRSSGCPDGSRCILCWADYACVPDGAVC